MLKSAIFSLTLRILTLGSKFILMLFMAKYMTPNDLGVFGLISITIALTIYVLGFDFYSYTTREILSVSENYYSVIIRDQIVFHVLIYIIVMPIILLVFITEYIHWQYVFMFYLLLILEHISHESYRLFVTLGKPVIANTVLFMRSGAWIYLVVVFAYFGKEYRNIDFILKIWSIGVGLSLLITFYFMREYNWRKIIKQAINWQWIYKGVKTSSFFFIATICYQLILYLDRFILKNNFGNEIIGVYTFYWSFANVIQIFIFTGITSIYHPKIIQSFKKNDMKSYSELMTKMAYLSIGLAIFIVLISIVIMPMILSIIDNDLYLEHINFYYMLLISMIILVATKIPHYNMYVRNMDKSYMTVILIGLLISIILNINLIPKYSLYGAGFTIIIVTSIIFILNVIILKKNKIKLL